MLIIKVSRPQLRKRLIQIGGIYNTAVSIPPLYPETSGLISIALLKAIKSQPWRKNERKLITRTTCQRHRTFQAEQMTVGSIKLQ